MGAVFVTPNGSPASGAIRASMEAATTPTVGDQLYCGQIFRARIRKRTLDGIDVNGAPFTPLSTKGPYYLYPNRDSAGGNRRAMATASRNRHRATGRIGFRTAIGIRYESYSAAKSAHGSGANLYGLEQHVHMLDTLLVKAGGAESQPSEDGFNSPSDLSAFEQNYPGSQVTLGFYGPEAERAKGNNEGVPSRGLPKREFFALSTQDLQLGERAIAQRMVIRARNPSSGPGGSGFTIAETPSSGEITLEDVGF